jgi:membrane protein YdbS with pleckstrin-like domain
MKFMRRSGASASYTPEPPSLRAQLLVSEYAGVVSTRSMTQSEVLVRISMFLTLVSASVVSLALIGQATGFGSFFTVFALVLLGAVVVIGALTTIRLYNGAVEDLAHVLALNRLRAAYLELDPGIEGFMLNSAHDDQRGSVVTYNHLGGNDRTQALGSSMVFITAVNGALLGVFVAIAAFALGAATWLIYVLAGVAAVVYLGVASALGFRRYRRVWAKHVPLSPTPS